MQKEIDDILARRGLQYEKGLIDRRVTQSDLMREALRSYIELEKVKEV